MRPVEFETQDIVQAGQRIEADGKRVTGYALRRLLGGGDQKRLLSVWETHQSRERNEDQQPTADLPVELEDILEQVSKILSAQIRSMSIKLNEIAVRSASRQVADITREYKELKDQTEAELKDAASIIEELENKNLELSRNLEAEIEAKETAIGRAEADREKAIALEARMKGMSGIEEIVNRLTALEKENTKL